MSTATNENKLRHHAEQQFAEELEELKKSDARQRPANWELSPWAVCTYLLGGELDNGFTVSAKYIGNRRIIETAVATLATDRALLLYGVPGTAKSWVSEHLAAAISGDSTRIIQGTAGTSEEQMRYGWNYAELLSKGPSRAALVESPLMRAMSEGRIARVEELTRIPADVQDTLITILSEKTLPIPELNDEVQAVRGFNLIATANNRDKGVNELSSALKRRFNTVILPVPATEEEEISIVSKRVSEMGRALELPAEPPAMHEVRRVVQIFRELRNGQTEDGKTKLKSPTGTMSTAEAISVLNSGMALAAHFGDGVLHARDVAASLVGAVVRIPCRTISSGASTSKQWSRNAPTGRISIAPAAKWIREGIGEGAFCRKLPPRTPTRKNSGRRGGGAKGAGGARWGWKIGPCPRRFRFSHAYAAGKQGFRMPGFSGCTHLGANGANAAPQLLQEEGRTPACRFGEKGFLESPLPSAGTLPQQFTKGFAMPDQTVRLFGIRHHGPGCARSLLQALEAMQPDCLLIEGPPDGESVLPFVLESGMCPPVALLVYAPDDSRRAVFYPFAEFSPEWQALRYGLGQSLPVRFMDLPIAHQFGLDKAFEDECRAKEEALRDAEGRTKTDAAEGTEAPASRRAGT